MNMFSKFWNLFVIFIFSLNMIGAVVQMVDGRIIAALVNMGAAVLVILTNPQALSCAEK